MQVIVKPLDRKKWHDKTGKESFQRPKSIEVLYDANAGKFATGLTDEEAKEYGEKLGVNLTAYHNPLQPHPYYSTKAAKIVLKNEAMIFDTNTPGDYVKVKNLKASKFVANSLKEWEEGLFPEATHVIFDEAEEVEIKASKLQLEMKAMALFSKMTDDQKVNLVQILDNKTVRGRSTDYLNVAIHELIKKDAEKFIRYASMDKTESYIRATLLEAISRNIVIKEGTNLFYMGDLIGADFEDAIKWFNNPQNSKIKTAMLEQMQK
jgi:hypothetical protein